MMFRRFLLALALGLVLVQGAFAGRIVPRDAQTGTLQGVDYPALRIDGKAYRLAPGAVIYDRSNRSILPNALPQTAKVYYTVDLQGQLAKVWIMTPDEEARPK